MIITHKKTKMKLIFIPLLVVATVFTVAGCSTTTTSAPIAMNAAPVVTQEIQHWTTSNGARVYFVPAPELPMLDVSITFDGGSARDGGKAGLALLTNSLLDDGAGSWNTDQIAQRFEGVGAQFGLVAHRDMASVTLRSLSDTELLQPALAMMTHLLHAPAFPQEAFERERKQMMIALRAEEQSPAALAQKAFYPALYGDHPYASPSMGTQESLEKLTLDDVRQFHAKYYVARNAVVAMTGNVNRKEAEKIAENLISPLSSGKVAVPLPPVKALTESIEINIDYPSSQTHVLMGQPGMHRGDPDYFTLYVGNHILGGGGLVSRMSEEVREKRGLSYSAYSYFSPMRQNGPFIVGLQTQNNQAAEALQVAGDTLREFVANGPTSDELVASKQNIMGGFPLRIASNSKIVGYLAMIGFYNLPLDYLDQFNPTVDSITLNDINKAFKARINPDKMVIVTVGGNASESE